jgi:hypothetical protein
MIDLSCYNPAFVKEVESLYLDGIEVCVIATLTRTDEETINDVIDQLVD